MFPKQPHGLWDSGFTQNQQRTPVESYPMRDSAGDGAGQAAAMGGGESGVNGDSFFLW
ncbi:MAG: hypothetical protein O8C65_15455 [Candidatus Methanoperedens sp.]|nr:hypothetical protein [Candidatus Methanoperedens sp.]